jgi:hypothetical protein
MKWLAALLLALTVMPSRAFEYCDDLAARKEMQQAAGDWERWLKEKRYDDLDQVFGALVAGAERGMSSDASAERALRAFERSGEWRDPRHRDWAQSHPDSAAASLARAHFHLGRAMRIRGDGSAAPSSEQLVALRAELQLARQSLARAERALRVRALGDALHIRIAAAEDGAAAAGPLIRESLAANPSSLAVRMAQVDANAPGLGGRRNDLLAVPGQAKALSSADRRYLEYLVYSSLGRFHRARGERSSAIADFARAHPLCPAFESTASELASLYLQERQYSAVIPVANHIIQNYPADGLGYTFRARALRGLGRHAEAVADLERAVDLGNTEAFGELAWFHETGTAVPRDLSRALDLFVAGEARSLPGAREGAERVRSALARGR